MAETCYARSQPAEWADLLRVADEQITAVGGAATRTAVERTHDYMSSVCSAIGVEANYYYALGSVMHGVGGELRQLAVYNNTVDTMADGLAAYCIQDGEIMNEVNLLACQTIGTVTLPILRLASRVDRPAAERTIGSLLSLRMRLQRSRAIGTTSCESERAVTIDIATTGLPLEEDIATTFFGATTVLLADALGIDETDPTELVKPISSLATPEQLRAICEDLIKPGHSAAALLRLDELKTAPFRHMVMPRDAAGRLTFQRDRLPSVADRPLDPGAIIRHEQPLQCPALAAHLIPLVARMLPDVLIAAETKVAEASELLQTLK